MDSAPRQFWRVGDGKTLDLSRPRVIAILNLTPDSFSDGGSLPTVDAAVQAAARAMRAGADMLDIGGESTRPGAERVSAEIQIQRTVPGIRAIRAQGGILAAVPISIDTTLAPVAAAALEAGADAVNDVAAGREDAAMLPLAACSGAGLILMHRLTDPGRDCYSDRYIHKPVYQDVVAEVQAFLLERAEAAGKAGVEPDRVVLDPGLGFGKSVEQNLELVRRTSELCSLGYPVLGAASRKSFVARASGTAGEPKTDRAAASIAFSILQLLGGVRLFRVHDVAEQVQALRAAHAIVSGSVNADPNPSIGV